MNDEFLRVNSKVDDDDIAKSEFVSKQENSKKEEQKKLTLITLLNFNRSKQTKFEIIAENFPNVRNILFIFFIHLSVVSILTLVSFLTTDVIVLMFNSAIASLLVPMIMLIFFYNFNKSKNTSIIEVITGIVLGLIVYVLLNFLEVYFNGLIQSAWLSKFLDVVIRDATIFLIANIFIKISKKDSLFDALLLTVCLYAGYIFATALDVLINSLFVNVELVVDQSTITTGAIVLSKVSFQTVISSFMEALLVDVLYLSSITFCFAIINGGVIGLNVSPIKDKRYKESSLYVLFFLTVLLHLGATFPSTMQVFNTTLKIISFAFSIILSVMILNYYLSKINVTKT